MPKELFSRWKLAKGDNVFVTDAGNGVELLAGDTECVRTMLAVAAGQMDEAVFAAWLREHSAPR